MGEAHWPYSLPIWRHAHRAVSPDDRFVAEIESAHEISMGNPTIGTLRLSAGLELKNCNPSFIWSGDSRYLAVPQYFCRFGLFRRQRLVIIDTLKRLVMASAQTAYYYLPESFSDGRLIAIKEPFRQAQQILWQIPGDLVNFRPVVVAWTKADSEPNETERDH